MARLTKADILAANDLKTKTVKVHEWGGEVEIRQWSVAEADQFGKMASEGSQVGFITKFRETVARLSIVDENGELMFGEDEIEALGKKAPAAMNRVHEAALKLNGLGKFAEKEGESPND